MISQIVILNYSNIMKPKLKITYVTTDQRLIELTKKLNEVSKEYAKEYEQAEKDAHEMDALLYHEN